MIKFFIRNRELIGIVLEPRNLELLQQGKPIFFDVPIQYRQVRHAVICFFETKEEAMKKLTELGFIDKTTLIIDETKKP